MVPNHPRYQLRYTRIFNFLLLPLWSNMWSKAHVRAICGGGKVRKPQYLQGVAGFRISTDGRGCYTLPNHALYHLSYTRPCDLYYILPGGGCQVSSRRGSGGSGRVSLRISQSFLNSRRMRPGFFSSAQRMDHCPPKTSRSFPLKSWTQRLSVPRFSRLRSMSLFSIQRTYW